MTRKPVSHHPSCKPSDRSLVWHCGQCGLDQEADISTDYTALLDQLEAMRTELSRAQGALVDAGTVPTETLEGGIRALLDQQQRDKAELEGLRRLLSGEQIGASTTIADTDSQGYGDLDQYGFFEFPVREEDYRAYRNILDQHRLVKVAVDAVVADATLLPEGCPEPWREWIVENVKLLDAAIRETGKE